MPRLREKVVRTDIGKNVSRLRKPFYVLPEGHGVAGQVNDLRGTEPDEKATHAFAEPLSRRIDEKHGILSVADFGKHLENVPRDRTDPAACAVLRGDFFCVVHGVFFDLDTRYLFPERAKRTDVTPIPLKQSITRDSSEAEISLKISEYALAATSSFT